MIKKTEHDDPYYVTGKDLKKNILYVSQNRESKKNISNLAKNYLDLKNINWISEIPQEGKRYNSQIRYHGDFLPCKIIEANNTNAKIQFEISVTVARGQSIVLYKNDICLGGGIV